MTVNPTLTILPENRQVAVIPGRNLLRLMADEGLALNQVCGGQGICAKCQIQVIKKIPPPSPLDEAHLSDEELARGFRLACTLIPSGGEMVRLPSASSASSFKHHISQTEFPVDPWQDLDSSAPILAVDMGTTTVIGHLLNPTNGRVINSKAAANQQTAYGADVMTRLAYASHGGAAARLRLQALAFDNLNKVADVLSVHGHPIRHVVAVMNTAMNCFLLNWDPDAIGRYPFQANTNSAVNLTVPQKVAHLAGAKLYLPPIIGGFVGSDTVAALYAARQLSVTPPYLVIDMGTNAEVALVGKYGITACSCAAGPAFEGGGIRHGMRAIQGAIQQVMFQDGRPEIDVIAGIKVRGITGSGFVSLLGGLLRSNALDRFGMISPAALAPGVVLKKNSDVTVQLADGIDVSQQDIQQLMFAKAAARAGAEALLQESNVRPQELNCIILCGTFAAKLRPEDVIAIGLVPRVDPSIISSIGNAAAEGACRMACSHSAFTEASRLARQTQHLGLSQHPNFRRLFEDHVCFG